VTTHVRGFGSLYLEKKYRSSNGNVPQAENGVKGGETEEEKRDTGV